jgi:hypothetical protein
MKRDRIGVVCLVLGFAASSAIADEIAAPEPKKTPAQAAHAKPAKPPVAQAGGLQDVKFSDPNAPPVGAAPASKSALAPAANGAPKEPAANVSLSLKWHAANEPVDPYNAIRHTSGPDGPGDAFEGGIKLGF